MLRILTARRRVRFLLCLVLAASGALFAGALLQRDGNFFGGSRRPIATDFVAFYAAGRIVASGDGTQLYDASRQKTEQTRSLGGEPQSFVPFPYPAWMVAPYVALAPLPYFPAFLIAMLAMTALLVPAVWLLRGVSSTVRADPLLVGLVLAASWPMVWGITNGQNVPFSLLCLAGAYAALRRQRDTAAGLWLGLLMGKPQLVALLLLLLAWRRRWRVVGVTAAISVSLGVAAVALAGPSWPRHFVAFAIGRDYNAEVDRAGLLQMSLTGAVAHLLGSTNPWTAAIVAPLALAVVAAVAYGWRGAQPTGAAFPLQFGLAIAATLAISPHALFYEAPLLALPVLALVDHWRASAGPGDETLTTGRRLLLVGLFVAGFGWQLAWVTRVEPLVVLPVVVGACVARELIRSQAAAAPDRLSRTWFETEAAA